MLHRRMEKILIALAWATPNCLAHWIAVRVFTYATVTKFRDVPLGEVGGAEAIFWWHESKCAKAKPATATAS